MDRTDLNLNSRALSVVIAGEAVSSVRYHVKERNTVLQSFRFPTWDMAHLDNFDDDTSEFTFSSTGPIFLDGNEIIGAHHAGVGFRPLPGGGMEKFPADMPSVVCHVCGKKRARIHYVCLTAEGTVTYLGKTCIWNQYADKKKRAEEQKKADMILFDPVECAREYEKRVKSSPHYNTLSVIAMALWLTETQGYRSRKTNDVPTADRMYMLLEQPHGKEWDAIENNLLAAAVLQQCALDELVDDDSDLITSVKADLRRSSVTQSALGRLAYLPTLYRRIEHEQTIQKTGAKTPDYADAYAGAVGEKLTAHVLVEEMRLLPSGSTLVTLKDDNGCRIVWFSSNPDKVPPVGGAATVTGMVKKHSEFNGTKSTIVNRCRFL